MTLDNLRIMVSELTGRIYIVDPKGRKRDITDDLTSIYEGYKGCPRCGEAATYRTPDGTYWDRHAHYWRPSEVVKPEDE